MEYIDTSILAAYYCPEKLSEKVEKYVVSCDYPCISNLSEIEMYSAVARKMREGKLAAQEADKIILRFRLHVDDGCYERIQIDSLHYDIARDCIGRFTVSLKSLDALHLAACLASGASLVTADRNLAESAKHFMVKVDYIS